MSVLPRLAIGDLVEMSTFSYDVGIGESWCRAAYHVGEVENMTWDVQAQSWWFTISWKDGSWLEHPSGPTTPPPLPEVLVPDYNFRLRRLGLVDAVARLADG